MNTNVQKFFLVKYILILLLSILLYSFSNSQLTFSQDITKEINDNISFEDTLKTIKKQIQYFKNQNELLSVKVDSLEKELFKLKTKQSFFSNELDEQTVRFSLIVTGLLALIAVVSFGSFRLEVKRVVKETNNIIEKQRQEFEDFKKRMKNNEMKSLMLRADICRINYENYLKTNDKFLAFWFALYTAVNCINVVEIAEDTKDIEDGYTFAKDNLKLALIQFKKIIRTPSLKTKVEERRNIISSRINELIKSENEEIIDLSSELRILIKKYLK